jgi:hypothetical protein
VPGIAFFSTTHFICYNMCLVFYYLLLLDVASTISLAIKEPSSNIPFKALLMAENRALFFGLLFLYGVRIVNMIGFLIF